MKKIVLLHIAGTICIPVVFLLIYNTYTGLNGDKKHLVSNSSATLKMLDIKDLPRGDNLEKQEDVLEDEDILEAISNPEEEDVSLVKSEDVHVVNAQETESHVASFQEPKTEESPRGIEEGQVIDEAEPVAGNEEKEEVTETIVLTTRIDEPVDIPSVYDDMYVSQIISEVHKLTNQQRKQSGRIELQYQDCLADIAYNHSQKMAELDFLSHVDHRGYDIKCRLEEAAYEAYAWGENIAMFGTDRLPEPQVLAEHFVYRWMDSDGHRNNILSSEYTHTGIGVAHNGDGVVYITVLFSEPKPF